MAGFKVIRVADGPVAGVAGGPRCLSRLVVRMIVIAGSVSTSFDLINWSKLGVVDLRLASLVWLTMR